MIEMIEIIKKYFLIINCSNNFKVYSKRYLSEFYKNFKILVNNDDYF